MSKSLEALERLCKVKIYQKEASAYDYLGKEIYKEEINLIKQDLERLEHYDNILTENLLAVEHLELTHSELVDLVGDYQILSKKILEQNKQLENENQELTKEKNATIILMQLMALDPNNIVESALILDKYKKTIEIIKGMGIWLNYDEEEINGSIEINGYFEITKEQYELLKEVLCDDKRN